MPISTQLLDPNALGAPGKEENEKNGFSEPEMR